MIVFEETSKFVTSSRFWFSSFDCLPEPFWALSCGRLRSTEVAADCVAFCADWFSLITRTERSTRDSGL